MDRLPPEARQTADRDNLDRAIGASLQCPACDAVLATYKLAMLNLRFDSAGPDGDETSSWSEPIGATVTLAPRLVDRRGRHPSGLRW